MTLLQADSAKRLADVEWLRASGLLDEAQYRSRVVLDPKDDAAEHYVTTGWTIGLDPNARFDGAFLLPFYESAGLSGPPAVTWLELRALGRELPAARAEAEVAARRVRSCRAFDAERYARRLPEGLDPAIHYVVVGEILGWQPSDGFDPAYYRERYRDVAASGRSPLLHYEARGRGQGRRTLSQSHDMGLPALAPGARPVVLAMSASWSTGAAFQRVNGLVRDLAERCRVVLVPIAEEAPAAELVAIAAATVSPLGAVAWCEAEMRRITERLIAAYRPRYAIAIGFEGGALVPSLVRAGVPSVALVDGLAEDTRPPATVRELFDHASHVIFPSAEAEQSAIRSFPDLAQRSGLHVDEGARGPIDLGRRVDRLGKEACRSISRADLDTLSAQAAIDPMLLLLPGSECLPPPDLERIALLRWRLWGGAEGSVSAPLLRRPCAGFHPQIYASAHALDRPDGSAHPLAHWLRSGRPDGPWVRTVLGPGDADAPAALPPTALHCHFHYPELAGDFLERLSRNRTPVDLFLSTDTEAKARALRRATRRYPHAVTIEVCPNRGRDIGPFLTGFRKQVLDGGYAVFGHVHAKRSLSVDKALGERWRNFLWENLIGGAHAMADVAASVFASAPATGLLIAEDPHLVSWNGNRGLAEELAIRMGIETPLDTFFDFPLGTMFWARPEALRPLLALDLGWEDYPPEPLGYDGTVLHALERILPFVVKHAGFDTAGLRVPGTTW